MSLRPRRAGLRTLRAYGIPSALCIALLILFAPGAAFAQDATPDVTPESTEVTLPAETTALPTESTPEPTAAPANVPARVIGSGIAAPLFDALANQAGVRLTTEVTGTNTGITDFCSGSAAATLATRALTAPEQQTCGTSGVEFQEVLIAHNAAAIIVNPANEFVQCYTAEQLAPLFTPSATATNWNQVAATNPDLALTVALPPSNTPAYALIDELVEGDALRVDTPSLADEASVIAAVAADRGTIGVVSLSAAQAAGDTVKLVELNFGTAGCAAPSAETIEGRTYNASQPILVYRNIAESGDVLTVLNNALSDEAASAVSEAGFVSPTAETLTRMRDGLANNTTGRLYTRTQTTYSISPNVTGAIEIAGTAFESDFVTNFATAFTGSYAGVTTNDLFQGQIVGVTRFCEGSVDLLTITEPLTQEQLDACAANNVTPYELPIGSNATVIVRNAADTFAQCLTLAQVATIFDDAANATMTNWNQVDPSYPDLPLFVFESGLSEPEVSLLLLEATGTNDPGRADAQVNADPLYRAAATGSTPGVISVYSWADYLAIVEAGQENIALVQIDGGNGCVEPSEATISDGSYPITRTLSLLVNRTSLNKPQVQAFVWFMYEDANYAGYQGSGLVGLTFGELPGIRAGLEETFTQVAVEALEASQATPEATSDASLEATAEATAEATQDGS